MPDEDSIRSIVRDELEKAQALAHLNRRQVLAGGALLAGGGGAGGLFGSAAAESDGSGQLGTEDNRIAQLYVDTIDANTVTGVEFDETLVADLDADGHDITNVGEFSADVFDIASLSLDSLSGGLTGAETVSTLAGDGLTISGEDLEVDEYVLSDGDAIGRDVWVIEPEASDPAGADSEDLIFEEEED